MRAVVITFIFLFLSSEAFAYVEEDTVGMAEATSGEQNTNMYKLNARGSYFVKKLKKIDEYAEKNNGAISLDLSNVEDIKDFEQKNSVERQNKKIAQDVAKILKNIQQLKITPKPEVYSSLTAINETRDAQTALFIQKQLKGGRR